MFKKLINFILIKIYILRGGKMTVAEFLAYRIANGKLEYKAVPKSLKAKVADCLRDLEAEDLIVE